MTNKIALALTAAFAMAGSAQAAWENISFESASTGWCSGGNCAGSSYLASATVNSVTVNRQPGTGDLMAQLTGTDNADVKLQQIAGSDLGGGYTLWYRFVTQDTLGGDKQDALKVDYQDSTLSGWQPLVEVKSRGDTSGQTAIDSGWLSIGLSSTTTDLRIKFTGEKDGSSDLQSWAFADVSPIPEPGEWAMILASFGLIGVITSRRRRGSSL